MSQLSHQAGLERAHSALADGTTLSPATSAPALAAIAVPSHPLARRLRGWAAWALIFALLAWAWAPAEMYRAGA
jgi:hypothetical protein